MELGSLGEEQMTVSSTGGIPLVFMSRRRQNLKTGT